MSWPEATPVTIEEVPFDGLTEPRGAAVAVCFPAWREHQGASEWNMRPFGLLGRTRALLLKGNDVASGWRRRDSVFDPDRLVVDRL
jgi:hypothetical protein